ncbi:MAG: hypothetical protein MUD16_00245 [Desulfobacterales bacterium]|nr:hypothetical protein [Desulfobacterales bacterium]
MEVERKIKALEAVYAVYDEFARTQAKACSPRCTTCCTTRVTVTTIEAFKVRTALFPGEWSRLSERLSAHAGIKRFRPRLTTNTLAALCAEGGQPPPENEEAPPIPCPLLTEELCSIYALRPFNCRCFTSRVPCAREGTAEVEEFALSLNTVCLQTIEHLDSDGCSGNLLDVLAVMDDERKRAAYAAGTLACGAAGLIGNRPMRVLMLPPEHRARMEPFLRKLREIRV